MDYIKIKLIKEEIREGEKLMSVRDMSEELKVNPNTVQRAYQELEREGITFTKRGKGTFIMEDRSMIAQLKKELSREMIKSFILKMKELGFNKEEILSIVSEELKGSENNE
ncbi:GntR family transcriptional regulator [Clostridium sp. D2Q-14]|nr:GntR family transcriptional regulator [Anaeromonas gelatinilytica]MBS4536735.1 GntR family transcriptional regulator [Anaeromonas gelatinilytica]